MPRGGTQIQPFQGLGIGHAQFWGAPVIREKDGTVSCPGFTGPTYASNAFDFVLIENSTKTPGICEVDVEKFRDIDKKKGAGTDGARITIHGIEPALIRIRVMIWTPEQYRQMSKLWYDLFPQANKRPANLPDDAPWPKTFDVHHPTFQFHQIKSVVFTRGDGPSPGPIPKSRVFTMHAVEFLQPGKKNTTQTAAQPQATAYDPVSYPPPGKDPKNLGFNAPGAG